MGVEDYAKKKAAIKAFDKDSPGREKSKLKELGEAQKSIERAQNTVKMRTAEWSLLYQQLYAYNKSWYPLADKIINKQAELKVAEKNKNKAKIATLKKEIDKLDRDASKVAEQFTKAHSELTRLDKDLRTIIDAAKKLP